MTATLDWNEYIDTARAMAAEGCVLLKNDNNALPFRKGTVISVFGRIALNYYKSGTGSGGMVNVSKVYGIIDGLCKSGTVKINEELLNIYEEWQKENPFEMGEGWGQEPWCQKEMPLSDDVVRAASEKSDDALVVIGRSAGEDKDCSDTEGSYRLTELEKDMLNKVRAHFKHMTVVLNVGSIMDMSFVTEYNPDAVMYVWQGGMVGGLGVADVLTGAVSPCGKLPDTIAYSLSDYPAYENFGSRTRNLYKEDIYVGYRYFETFAKDRVQYPFGFGLSYTDFDVRCTDIKTDGRKAHLTVEVKNTGNTCGKEVVQVYLSAPQGLLGKAARELAAFEKTGLIEPGCTESLMIDVDIDRLAAYDDSGRTGYQNAFVLEAGSYVLYVGTDVRTASETVQIDINQTIVVEQTEEAMAPVTAFDRIVPESHGDGFVIGTEPVPTLTIDENERRLTNMPEDIAYTGDFGISLNDVKNGRASMENFISQLTDEDLIDIVRGEGMGSSLVTPGTAAAFGGVNEHLRSLGVPAVCCDDGPSGMRLDSGAKAFSIPIGTLIAASFNKELTTELFEYLGLEMAHNRVDCLLGPGMNIHRHPLNGRNFEYFSEDPYLTGIMAAAELKGLHKNGVTGTIKHFCGNNQELARHYSDSVISQRALREIYLKGFEMAVKDGGAITVMTTYGSVNGLWTAGNYDLNTTILRKEWGFDGITMTDWWASINDRGGEATLNNFAAMVRAQNDVYMVCPDSTKNSHGDNTAKALKDGTLMRAELVRNAMNICSVAMRTHAMKVLNKEAEDIEIIHRDDEAVSEAGLDIEMQKLGDYAGLGLDGVPSVKGTDYIWSYEVINPGEYSFEITGSSELSELAQIPCTLFLSGIPCMVFTFNGTGGKNVTLSKEYPVLHRFLIIRLHVGADGLNLKELVIRRKPDSGMSEEERIIVTRNEVI